MDESVIRTPPPPRTILVQVCHAKLNQLLIKAAGSKRFSIADYSARHWPDVKTLTTGHRPRFQDSTDSV